MERTLNIADILKQIYNSKAPVRINIIGESFTSKVLAYDTAKKTMTYDELIPKYGCELLKRGESYDMSQIYYDAGLVNELYFRAEYQTQGKFHNLPAIFFGLPTEIRSNATYYSIEPNKVENVVAYFNLPGKTLSEKVSRISVKGLELKAGMELDIAEKGQKLGYIRISLPNDEITVTGVMQKFTKYVYKIDFTNLSAESFNRINKYLADKYREESGARSGTEHDNKLVIPGVLVKPKYEAPAYKGKILIVDDEILMTELLVNTFKKAGYNSTFINNSSEALEKAAQFQPNAILLDIMMPDYDGFTICRRLKRDPRTKDIPIIMISGIHNKEDVLEAQDAGAVYFFVKSASMDLVNLVTKVEEIIQK